MKPMLERLIERTNKEEFYNGGRILLKELRGELGNNNEVEFNFIIDEVNPDGKIIDVEHWKLVSQNTITFNGIYSDLYLPYYQFKVLTEHPLLWTYTKPLLNCELINYPKNLNEFIGELFLVYEKITGNWIPVHKNFWNLTIGNFKSKGIWDIKIQEPLRKPIEEICDKHGVEFKVKYVNRGENKGYGFRPVSNLLIIGNEEFCSNHFSFGQPYIIAENFTARLQ